MTDCRVWVTDWFTHNLQATSKIISDVSHIVIDRIGHKPAIKMTIHQRSGLLYSMFQLSLFLLLVVEGFPSLLVDESESKESIRLRKTPENSSEKSSADLLSDLLLDLREEREMTRLSASTIAKVQNEETWKHQENLMSKGGQDGESHSDFQKSANLTMITTAPDKRKNKELSRDKEIGVTNIDSGTEKGFEGLQRPLPKIIETLPRDESSKNAENEDCKPERWCHTTYSNEYQTMKEEDCKETFAR